MRRPRLLKPQSTQVIRMQQAGHFPKHLPIGDSKPTPKPQKQKTFEQNWKGKVFPSTRQDTREQGVARQGSCGQAESGISGWGSRGK